jgi:hypothetical protein
MKKFPAFYGTRRVITAFTRARNLSLSWASPIQSMPSHPTSWRSSLILFSHLRLGLQSGLLPSGLPAKSCVHLSLPHSCYMLRPSHSSLFDLLNNTGYTQKNGAVSKVNKIFISHLTRAQRTASAAATVQVSHALITILQRVHPGSHDTHPHGNQIHPRLGVACPL